MVTSENDVISPSKTQVERRDQLRINSLKELVGAPVYTLGPEKFEVANRNYHIDATLSRQGTLTFPASDDTPHVW